MKLRIANIEHEGWEVCAISGNEFYMNPGLNFFIDNIKPVSYCEGIRWLRKKEKVKTQTNSI